MRLARNGAVPEGGLSTSLGLRLFDSWLHELGRYHFAADILQTIIPLPTLAKSGAPTASSLAFATLLASSSELPQLR